MSLRWSRFSIIWNATLRWMTTATARLALWDAIYASIAETALLTRQLRQVGLLKFMYSLRDKKKCQPPPAWVAGGEFGGWQSLSRCGVGRPWGRGLILMPPATTVASNLNVLPWYIQVKTRRYMYLYITKNNEVSGKFARFAGCKVTMPGAKSMQNFAYFSGRFEHSGGFLRLRAIRF